MKKKSHRSWNSRFAVIFDGAMLVERDDVVEDSHRPWVDWNRSKFWLSAILADTSISHGKSRRHMIAAAMIGKWDSHCRLFLWTPLPVHPEELGHGDRYIDSTLFSPQAQVWPFEHIPTETFETMKHSEAFEFFERRESKDASFWCLRTSTLGPQAFFHTVLCRTKRRGLIWIVRRTLSANVVYVANAHCLGRCRCMYVHTYVYIYTYIYIYIICIRFIVSVYNDLANWGIFGAHLLVHLRIKHLCQRRVWRSKILSKILDFAQLVFSSTLFHIIQCSWVHMISYDKDPGQCQSGSGSCFGRPRDL